LITLSAASRSTLFLSALSNDSFSKAFFNSETSTFSCCRLY
jgi:hypothetical protein